MTQPRVGILDYGTGNLFSVAQAVEACGGVAITTSSQADLGNCDRIILPGVGAFATGMDRLRDGGFVEFLQDLAVKGKPMLGICLGMQLLFDRSEEMGDHPGLGIFKGTVKEIPRKTAEGTPRRVPHIGWNTLCPVTGSTSWKKTELKALDERASVYFVHSFHPIPKDKSDILAIAHYEGVEITAVVRKKNVLGCQFHPEKSGTVGLSILSNWIME